MRPRPVSDGHLALHLKMQSNGAFFRLRRERRSMVSCRRAGARAAHRISDGTSPGIGQSIYRRPPDLRRGRFRIRRDSRASPRPRPRQYPRERGKVRGIRHTERKMLRVGPAGILSAPHRSNVSLSLCAENWVCRTWNFRAGILARYPQEMLSRQLFFFFFFFYEDGGDLDLPGRRREIFLVN